MGATRSGRIPLVTAAIFILQACLWIFLTAPCLAADPAKTDPEQLNEEFQRLYKQGRYREALPLGNEVIVVRTRVLGSEHPKTLLIKNNVAATYHALGDYWKAEPLLKEITAVLEKRMPDDEQTVIAIVNLGSLYRVRRDFGKAEPLYRKALSLGERVYGKDHPSLAPIIRGLSLLYLDVEDFGRAEEFAKKSLIMSERFKGPDSPETGFSLSNLALIYIETGDYGRAEALSRQAATIAEKSRGPGHPETAASLSNLATLYSTIGEEQLAEEYHQKALALLEASLGRKHPSTGILYHNMALHYEKRGDYRQAWTLLEKALAIHTEVFGAEHDNVTIIRVSMGYLHLESGNFDKAREIFTDINHRPGLGRYYLATGRPDRAEEEFRRALEVDLKRGKPGMIASDHLGLALVLEARGRLAEAEAQYRRAIERIESLWKTLSAGVKKNFLSGDTGIGIRRLEAYEGLIRVLLKQGPEQRSGEAFEVAERVKGRRFLELLSARDLRGRRGTDETTLAEERSRMKTILSLRHQVEVLEAAGEIARASDLADRRKALIAAEESYDRFIEDVKLGGAEVADLLSFVPVTLSEVQAILDPDTTLVEYYAAKDTLYTWVITQREVRVHQTAIREESVQRRVDDLLYSTLTDRMRAARPMLLRLPSADLRGVTVKAKDMGPDRFPELSQAFYNDFLGPVAEHLKTGRLVIVPHGALHKVPFAALHDRRGPFGNRAELVTLPAAGVLRHVVAKRKKDMDRLVVFANPRTKFLPLEHAEAEGRSVSAIFPVRRLYTGEQATKATALRASEGQHVIHFATHGEFHESQPLQSGLILAPDQDDPDGILRVHEIFGMDLAAANLVTLSACETALAKVYGGDDLVGLSRGFIYAGTPSLIATLWAVDDRSTRSFMELFYRSWRSGKSKAAAFRDAQRSLRETTTYRHPFYWAPFVLIGDGN
jgi:tetratricopeptide (TPR) repeat protein